MEVLLGYRTVSTNIKCRVIKRVVYDNIFSFIAGVPYIKHSPTAAVQTLNLLSPELRLCNSPPTARFMEGTLHQYKLRVAKRLNQF